MTSINKLILILCFAAFITNNVVANIFADKKIKRVPREFHKNSKNRINQYKKIKNKHIKEEFDENIQFIRVYSTLDTSIDNYENGNDYGFMRKLESSDNEYMRNIITHFNNLIEESYNHLNDAYINDNLGTDCTFYRACENTVGYGEYSESSYSKDIQFGNLSTNRDKIMFKKSVSSILNETKNLKDICIINDQIDIWKNHLEENLCLNHEHLVSKKKRKNDKVLEENKSKKNPEYYEASVPPSSFVTDCNSNYISDYKYETVPPDYEKCLKLTHCDVNYDNL